MAKYEWVVSIAGIISIIGAFQLYYDIYMTHDTSSLSFRYLFIRFTTQLLVLFYAYVNKLVGILWPTFVVIVGYFYIFFMKITYPQEINNSNTK